MTIKLFNVCLAVGWLLLVIGVALWSVPAALVVGGCVLLGITLLLALRVGVATPKAEDGKD